jgi:hypothetical protein
MPETCQLWPARQAIKVRHVRQVRQVRQVLKGFQILKICQVTQTLCAALMRLLAHEASMLPVE